MTSMQSEGAGGWVPDEQDDRDHTPDHPEIQGHLARMGLTNVAATAKAAKATGSPTTRQRARAASPKPLPSSVDLREWCSDVVDQGQLNSCTAHAAVGVVEYLQRRMHGKAIVGSRLFVYKVARNMLQWEGDKGAYLRTAMGTIAMFGLPPERYWPYDAAKVDDEPPPFCYAIAQGFQGTKYFRLDPQDMPKQELLNSIKTTVAHGLPPMFGFYVYLAASVQAKADGKIPFPTDTDIKVGGHAMGVFGYDDSMKIKNTSTGGQETVGAFLCRNSRGPDWGDGGYGWLPYEYVLQGKAVDWWVIMSTAWVNLDPFKAVVAS